METQSISKNLIYQRKLKGYTQEQLSEKTQVTVRTIQRIEKGEVSPHLQTIKLLAAALDLEVDDILILENPKEENLQKKWLMLMHGTPIIGLILPLCNILLPLFLWIHKREDNKIYNAQGIAVINFQISMTILYVIAFISLMTIAGFGFVFFIAVIPISVLITLFNLFRVINDKSIYYPLSIPFIKKQKLPLKQLILAFFACATLCISNGQAQEIKRIDGSTITTTELTQHIERLMEAAEVTGLSVSIFNNNKVKYHRNFGYKNLAQKETINDSTNIYGASFSKAVFAVIVMNLVENGVIDLDTPLESYLPKRIYEYEPQTRWHDDFSALKNDSSYHKITARMCLNHTTGFLNSRGFEPDYQLRVHGKPGSRFKYSGEGFIYLQVVLEKILEKDLEQIAQDLLFEPLQMDNSSYQWQEKFNINFAYGYSVKQEKHVKDKDNEPRAGGTLETSPEDYTRFLQAVMNKEIISTESWKEIFTPQVRIKSIMQFGPLSDQDSTLNDNIQLSYGLGWGILQTPYGPGAFKEGHGNGFQHYAIVFPEVGMGIMLMTNSDNGESIFKELLEVSIKDTYTPWKWENYIPYN